MQEKSFEWIVSAIQSSTNPFHIECCKKLIELYVAKFNQPRNESVLLEMLVIKSDEVNYI
jgi:hypothetical protein